MAQKKQAKRNNLLAGLLIVIAIVAATVLVLRPDTSEPKPSTNTPPTTSDQTFTGEAVCLPHKDTTGAQTLECALGIKLDDGTYYGLRSERNLDGFEVGKQLKVTGTLKAEESDRYQSVGTITVKQAAELQ
jgi:hypothetical protein